MEQKEKTINELAQAHVDSLLSSYSEDILTSITNNKADVLWDYYLEKYKIMAYLRKLLEKDSGWGEQNG